MMTTEILLFITFVLGIVYLWIKHHYSYWKRKGVPYIPATPLIGNLKDIMLFKTSPAEGFADLYNHENAKNEPVVGIHVFHKPGLLIREPELIKRILIKDFNNFSNRYSTSDPHSDKLGSYNLFFLKNPSWKQMRAKLTPTFTSGKMKQMFGLMDEIGKKLHSHLYSLTEASKGKTVEMELKEVCALYATDVIASIAYGVDANSIKNPDGDFRRNGRNIFKFTPYRAIEFSSMFFLPQIVSLLKFKVFSKESTSFIRSTIEFVMNEREKSGTKRNDLIDTLMSLRKDSRSSHDKNEIVFDGDILIAQAAVFFTAGFETSSSAMSFALYELSNKQECQKRLRAEIKEVLDKNKGELSYEVIQNMKYLNMVLQEALRKYPPLPFLDRECVLFEGDSDYSLEPYSSFAIPNGMPVYIPAYAIQRDPKYFPNPDEFDPERFAPENKDNILPNTYMPFGIGPHNCIGERFGLIQAKIGLVNFLKEHSVRPSSKSHKEMKFEKKALIVQPEGGIHCEVVRDPLH